MTNTGDVTLTGLNVVDDVLGPIGETIASLSPGASVELTETYTIPANQIADVVNTVTVCTDGPGEATGIDALGRTVTDTDDATIGVVLGLVVATVPPAAGPSLQLTSLDPLHVGVLGHPARGRRRSAALVLERPRRIWDSAI